MTSAFVSLCFLVLAGAALHLAWRLALLALLWAPSAAGGIVAGWHVALWSRNVALGVATAMAVAAFARSIVKALVAQFTPCRVLFVAWTEG